MHFRFKNGIQFGVFFAPLLALLVGLALFLRPDHIDEIDTRMGLIRLGFNELAEMERTGRRALNSQDPLMAEAWERQYRAAGRVLMTQLAERNVEKSTVDLLIARHTALGFSFSQLVAWQRLPVESRDAVQGIHREEEVLRQYQELYSGLLSLIEINQHHQAVTQQHLDAVVILFAALAALVLSGLAYAVGRSEMTRRGKMAFELEQSNILLSDAFVRLRRAEQGFQQERLQLLRKMIQGVIQEVRSHLQPVIRAGETLLDYVGQPVDATRERQALSNLIASACAAKATLDRFAQIAEAPSTTMVRQSVDLNRAMEEALNASQPQIEAAAQRGVAIRVEKNLASLPRIDGAESEWRESLAHLIENALEAMPEGGVLTLETFEEGDRVGFRVSDSGKGMSDGVRRHCCEPFFSTKEQEASGLGLTLMAGTVRRYNGSIEIGSQPGVGTRISVRLPQVQAEEPALAGSDEPQPSVISPQRILLVDDEPWVREALRDLLVADGHSVSMAGQGNEALSVFKAGAFDLVITDRAMPGMDGEHLAEEIKRIRPRTAVILLTGLGDIIRNAGVTSRHVEVIVSKPVTPDQLRKALVEALRLGT